MAAAPVKAVASAPAPAAAEPGGDRKANAANRQKRTEQAKPLKKEQSQVEQRLAAAQAQHAQLLAAMGDAALPATKRAEQGRQLKELADSIETLEQRWLEIGEALEEMARD